MLLAGAGVKLDDAVHLVLARLSGQVATPLLSHHMDEHWAHSVRRAHLCGFRNRNGNRKKGIQIKEPLGNGPSTC